MSLEALSHLTYELRHSPNCPSRFCIVTIGDGALIYPHYDRRNLHSFGKTLDGAVKECLRDVAQHEHKKRERIADQQRLMRIERATWRMRDVVWA